MSTWQPGEDEFRTRRDEHEARLEAQGYVAWMRERQRQESLERLVQALCADVRQLRDELSSVQCTVESLLQGGPEPAEELSAVPEPTNAKSEGL
jgi:hypothetical protein